MSRDDAGVDGGSAEPAPMTSTGGASGAGSGGSEGEAGESAAGSGGAPSDQAGGGPSSSAPNSAGSSAPAAGSGGAGAAAVGSSEVRGRVIDFYQHAAEGVQVTIGGTTVHSGSDGAFVVPSAPASYDVTLLVAGSQQQQRSVVRFEGLTRRDPTLQIAQSSGPERSESFDVRIRNVDFESRPEGDVILTSYSTPNGLHVPTLSNSSASFSETVVWNGPNRARITAHALRMLKLPTRIEATDFYSYDTQVFELAEGGVPPVVDFDLPNTDYIGSSTLVGTLERPPGSSPVVEMYLRFPDHGLFPLVHDTTVESAFSYFFPVIPGSTVTVVASDTRGTTRIAHVDGITSKSDHFTLTLPEAPVLTAPPEQSGVDANTTFQWTDSAKVFAFLAFAYDKRDELRVITAKPEARLPSAPGYDLLPNQRLAWSVATHGSYASVDEAAGPTGFLDTCAFYFEPHGPERGTGSYAASLTRDVTTR